MSQQQAELHAELERDLYDALDCVAVDKPEQAKLLAWAAGVTNWKPKQERTNAEH